jgi:hypothetical protein
MMLTVSRQVFRRYILGLQGLWPGRRWQGLTGTAQALRTMEALQLDPLNVIARSHDIALWGRVLDYQPSYLDIVTYQERKFFDYGGSLFIYPMDELPYWRLHMSRRAETPYRQEFVREHQHALAQVYAAITGSGPQGNRDFQGNRRVNSYRGRKDTGVALFHWWLVGEMMITHRQGFERIYDLRSRVAPVAYDYVAPVEIAEDFFARKSLKFLGAQRAGPWKTTVGEYISRKLSPQEGSAWLARLIAEGVVTLLQLEGSREPWYTLTENMPYLNELVVGKTPSDWQPLETTNEQEVVFLAPLEIVSARGRAGLLFDFDYVWEVYKPAAQRRWGYYVLPILFGDQLVGRLDPKLDRKSGVLQVNGFWLEDLAFIDQPAFSVAMAKGFDRFRRFLNARQIDFEAVSPPHLRAWLQALI